MSKTYVKLPPLEVEPQLADALNAYVQRIGVPRARVMREILRSFLGPMATAPTPPQTPEDLQAVDEGPSFAYSPNQVGFSE